MGKEISKRSKTYASENESHPHTPWDENDETHHPLCNVLNFDEAPGWASTRPRAQKHFLQRARE